MCGAPLARAATVHDRVGNAREDRRLEAVAHLLQPRALFLALGDRQLGGVREAHRVRDVLGSRAAAAILRAAVKERLDRETAANEHRADALRRADLVAGDGEHVERRLPRVDRDLAERLDGVGVEEGARARGPARRARGTG